MARLPEGAGPQVVLALVVLGCQTTSLSTQSKVLDTAFFHSRY